MNTLGPLDTFVVLFSNNLLPTRPQPTIEESFKEESIEDSDSNEEKAKRYITEGRVNIQEVQYDNKNNFKINCKN